MLLLFLKIKLVANKFVIKHKAFETNIDYSELFGRFTLNYV